MSTLRSQLPEFHPEPVPPVQHRRRWPRVVAWIAAGLLLLIVVVVGAFFAVLHSARFHNYLLAKVQHDATESLGAQVQLQNFALNLSNLTLDLYGVTVHGAAPYPDPPLLQVQHLHAGIRIVSLLSRKWYMDTVQIDHPVVYLFTDAKGVSNIPKPKSSGGNSNTSIFDLGIRHAILSNGEAYYNNKQSVLDADLHDLEFRAAFDPTQKRYSGKVSYSDGHLTSGTLRTFGHSLDSTFSATPTTFQLTNAKLSSGQSQFLLNATLQNYSNPQVQAQYEAVINGGDVRTILNNTSVPTGILRASGTAQYSAVPNRPLLETLSVNGNLSSQQIDVATSSLRTQIRNVAAQYSLSNGNADVSSFRAMLLGGELKGSAKMNAIGGDTHSQVEATLHGVSLAAARSMMHTAALPRDVSVAGGLNADVTAAWGKTLDNLVAHANAAIDGRVSGNGANGTGGTVIPVHSAIHAIYTGSNQQIALNQSYVRMPQSTLDLNGVMSKRSSLALRFHSIDLHELETVASLFRAANPGAPPQPLDLAGTASFEGLVQGSTAAPHLTGKLVASDLRVHGTNWRSLQTNVDVSPSLASLQNARLQPATQGNIAFNASAGLTKWAFKNTSPIQIDLNASQLNVAEFLKAAGSQAPVSGTLSANVKMHGTELHPVGQGNVSLAHSVVYNEPIRSVQVDFSGTGDEVHGNLAIAMPAGNVQGVVSVRPQAKAYTAQLTGNGIDISKLQTVKAKNLAASGMVNIHATGQGTFDNPQLDASVQVPRLEIQKQVIQQLNLEMNVADHVANANLSANAVNTSIRGKANVHLTGDYLADATIDTQQIPLQPLVAIYAPAQAADLSGTTEIHGTLHGPLKNKNQLEAHLRIPMLKLAYGPSIQLAAAAPIEVDYKDGVVALQRGVIRGTDTDLQFQGSIPTVGNAPMSLLLLGTVNLHLAELLSPDMQTSGQLKFNINSYGATHDPNVEGQIQIVDANFANGDLPVGLQHGNGVLTLTKDRLNITSFQGTVGGGTVTAQGGVAYRPNMQFDLGLSAKDIRLLYPQGVREGINADLRLSGTTENALLGGSVNIADVSFTPAFDLTSFINQFSGGVAAPPSQGFTQNVQLNLSVHSANNINLVSRAVSVNGTANLQVRGTAAQPVILGRVNLDGGDLIFNGDRFVLNGGTIQFVNPVETQPVVNLALNTTIQQYNIYMRFNGPVDQLHTDYASDPSLPAADIINLLAFGKTTEANSPDAATPANQAAESLVASQVSSQVTSRVSKVAGISQLSINPVLAGGTSQGPPGANVTIQQRVTGNLFVTFSSNVASTQNQTIMGQYQISPRVAVSATRDQNGGFAVDATIKKTW